MRMLAAPCVATMDLALEMQSKCDKDASQIEIRRARATTGHFSAARLQRTTKTSLCRATVGQTCQGIP